MTAYGTIVLLSTAACEKDTPSRCYPKINITCVANQSQTTLMSAYQNAMKEKIGSAVEVSWKNKNGGEINTRVILVPFSFGKELRTLHFITAT